MFDDRRIGPKRKSKPASKSLRVKYSKHTGVEHPRAVSNGGDTTAFMSGRKAWNEWRQTANPRLRQGVTTESKSTGFQRGNSHRFRHLADFYGAGGDIRSVSLGFQPHHRCRRRRGAPCYHRCQCEDRIASEIIIFSGARVRIPRSRSTGSSCQSRRRDVSPSAPASAAALALCRRRGVQPAPTLRRIGMACLTNIKSGRQLIWAPIRAREHPTPSAEGEASTSSVESRRRGFPRR